MQWAPALRGRGVALTTHAHLAPMLKEEYSYTSIPRLGLHGLCQGELYLFTFIIVECRTCLDVCNNHIFLIGF